MLQNDLISLRPVEETDLALLVKWRNTPRIWRGFFNKFPLALGGQQAWYAALNQSTTRKLFMICRGADGAPIGTIGLDDLDFVNRSAEIGNLLIGDEDNLHKGLAAEAAGLLLAFCFEHLGLHRVCARVYAHNAASLAVWQRVGMIHEGVLRGSQFASGEYRDVLMLSILADEYASARSHTGLAA